ncbi:MAG: hypothetical protein ACLQU1_40955 [Bryobacteraceae bacterium]
MNGILWVLPAMAAVCAAQSAETRQARAKRVVDEAIQALGGHAFLHVDDRVETGRSYSFDNGKLAGTIITTIYTRYLTPVPGKVEMLEKDAFGKPDESTSGLLYTMEGAWDYTFHGARPMDDQRLADHKDNVLRNIFYILRQRLNEPGMSLYSQGSDLFENRQVEIVDITDGDNNTVTVYFSQTDKVPVRQTFRRRNTTYNDFDTEATLYAKYHESGGIQWPMDIRRDRNGVKIYEMYCDSAEFNKHLKDSVFTLPAKMKMLPKGK